MTYIKKCIVCGKEFETNYPKKIICGISVSSNPCHVARYRENMRKNYRNNKEAYKVLSDKWKKLNPEKQKESMRKSYKKAYTTEEGRTRYLNNIKKYRNTLKLKLSKIDYL